MASTKPPLDAILTRYSFGNTGLNSRQIFKERDLFDKFVFPNLLLDNFFDFWKNDNLYGRIDTEGDPVYVKESFLKQLRYSSDSETYFAANFVADAWRDFCDKIRDLKNKNIIKDSGPYADMTVAKSWRSPSAEYHNYMTNILFPVFSNTFMSLSERENNTKDFGTFLNTFTEFSNTVLQEVGPLTFSGFLESGLTSPFTTGLVIEVSYDDHNDDFNKLKTFFYDENFELVSKICTQYGFSIDKNAPWRFVADIGSEAMQEYIFGLPLSGIEPLDVNDLTDCEEPIVNDDINQRNEPSAYSQVIGLESVLRHSPGYRPYRAAETSVYSRQPYETVFAAAYRDPYELDIPFLQVYLLDFYNRHILKKPYYEETPQNTRVCNPFQTVLIERDEASPSVYEVFSRKWALKTYYMLRCEEKKLHKSTKEKTKDFRRAISIYDLSPGSPRERFLATLRYIRENILVKKTSKDISSIYQN